VLLPLNTTYSAVNRASSRAISRTMAAQKEQTADGSAARRPQSLQTQRTQRTCEYFGLVTVLAARLSQLSAHMYAFTAVLDQPMFRLITKCQHCRRWRGDEQCCQKCERSHVASLLLCCMIVTHRPEKAHWEIHYQATNLLTNLPTSVKVVLYTHVTLSALRTPSASSLHAATATRAAEKMPCVQ
jgi:hypothetical protein